MRNTTTSSHKKQIQANSSKQFREYCIFCQGSKPLSLQHVWPDWMKAIFPRAGAKTIFASVDNRLVGAASLREKRRDGHLLTTKFRKVCVECNNGWISALENQVRPSLTKLILGKAVALTADELTRISTWAAIVTIMAEYTQVELRGIPPEDAHSIYAYRKPPTNWKIYLGDYSGRQFAPCRYRHSSVVAIPKSDYEANGYRPSHPNAQSSTHVLGNLLILADRDPPGLDLVGIGADARQCLERAWPTRDLTLLWPPVLTLGDAAVEFITTAMARKCEPWRT